jgi:serine/threonine protein kinase
MVDHTGSQLGKYKLLKRLGRGGMADVYKAVQPGLERPVAVKIMYPHLAETPGFVDRFQREAQAIARLHHPHIVQVYDYSSEGDLHYMVMEFVEGQTLKARLDQAFARGEQLPLAEVVGLFHAVLAAVDYAHNHNVVHRDLKPGNLIIEQGGRPVLSDFGIAKIVGASKNTTTGQSVGTPAYMSPEQGQGESGDRRSDIYALGIMLYECLTGHVPYDGDTSVTIMLKHINAPIPALRQARPDLSPALEAVVTRALAKSPGDRFHTAAEMWTALRAAVEGSGAAVAGSSPVRVPAAAAKPHRTRPAWFRRPVWIALAALLLVAILAGAGAYAFLPAFSGPSPAEQAASQGQSLLAAGKYQLALDSFGRALQSDPHNVAALVGHARA